VCGWLEGRQALSPQASPRQRAPRLAPKTRLAARNARQSPLNPPPPVPQGLCGGLALLTFFQTYLLSSASGPGAFLAFYSPLAQQVGQGGSVCQAVARQAGAAGRQWGCSACAQQRRQVPAAVRARLQPSHLSARAPPRLHLRPALPRPRIHPAAAPARTPRPGPRKVNRLYLALISLSMVAASSRLASDSAARFEPAGLRCGGLLRGGRP
jgi:hypothetical protein